MPPRARPCQAEATWRRTPDRPRSARLARPRGRTRPPGTRCPALLRRAGHSAARTRREHYAAPARPGHPGQRPGLHLLGRRQGPQPRGPQARGRYRENLPCFPAMYRVIGGPAWSRNVRAWSSSLTVSSSAAASSSAPGRCRIAMPACYPRPRGAPEQRSAPPPNMPMCRWSGSRRTNGTSIRVLANS